MTHPACTSVHLENGSRKQPSSDDSGGQKAPLVQNVVPFENADKYTRPCLMAIASIFPMTCSWDPMPPAQPYDRISMHVPIRLRRHQECSVLIVAAFNGSNPHPVQLLWDRTKQRYHSTTDLLAFMNKLAVRLANTFAHTSMGEVHQKFCFGTVIWVLMLVDALLGYGCTNELCCRN